MPALIIHTAQNVMTQKNAPVQSTGGTPNLKKDCNNIAVAAVAECLP